MPAYTYRAIDARGKTVRGVIEAEAPRLARAGLRRDGLVPVDLSPIGAEAGASRGLAFLGRGGLPAAELALLTRRFALLLEAGLTVEQALDALLEEGHSERTSRVLAAVRADVLSGHTLAASLEQHSSSFDEVYRALVATGERSGELPGVMSRLASHLESSQAVRQAAGLALVYPAVVAVTAFLIVLGLLAYVVPQVVQVFQHGGQSLPLLTRLLMGASDALALTWPWMIVAAAAASAAWRWAWRREEFRLRWHRRILGLPVAGALARGSDTARLSAALGILVESGVPLVQALEAGVPLVRNLELRRAVDDAARQLREGASLHRSLSSSGRFPPLFLHLVASGEAGGRLAHMFGQAARQLQYENEARVKLLAGLLEPAIILLMGVVVLLVVLGVLLPIIEMNHLVRP